MEVLFFKKFTTFSKEEEEEEEKEEEEEGEGEQIPDGGKFVLHCTYFCR